MAQAVVKSSGRYTIASAASLSATQSFRWSWRRILARTATPPRPMPVVDGSRMPSELLGELDLLVRPEEVGGVAVYNSPIQTPAEFRGFSDCGAIVIWTRPPRKGAKAK